MGNKLFGKDIAGTIASKMGPLFPVIKLLKITTGARDATDPASGPAQRTSTHNCRGILEDYRDSQLDGTIIKRGDRKLLLLGDTLPSGVVPEPNDKAIAETSTFYIVAVTRDPDAATYTCQVRGS